MQYNLRISLYSLALLSIISYIMWHFVKQTNQRMSDICQSPFSEYSNDDNCSPCMSMLASLTGVLQLTHNMAPCCFSNSCFSLARDNRS